MLNNKGALNVWCSIFTISPNWHFPFIAHHLIIHSLCWATDIRSYCQFSGLLLQILGKIARFIFIPYGSSCPQGSSSKAVQARTEHANPEMKRQVSSQCRLQKRGDTHRARFFGRLPGAHRQESVRSLSPQMATQEVLSFPSSPTETLWKIQWATLSEMPQVSQGFPGGSVVKNPPAVQETWVRPLVEEESTCHGTAKPVCHNYWACAPEPGKATNTEACTSQNLCSATRGAAAVRSPPTTTREKPAWQWRPRTAKNKLKSTTSKIAKL